MAAGCILNRTRESKMELPDNREQRMRFHKIAGVLLLLGCCGSASLLFSYGYLFLTPPPSGTVCARMVANIGPMTMVGFLPEVPGLPPIGVSSAWIHPGLIIQPRTGIRWPFSSLTLATQLRLLAT